MILKIKIVGGVQKPLEKTGCFRKTIRVGILNHFIMKRNINYLFASILLIAFHSCKPTPPPPPPPPVLGVFPVDKVTPQDFPKLNIPGFNFPEDSTVINNWIAANDTVKIFQHGWGIWTGLTSLTNPLQTVGGQGLRVYETWLTPGEIVDSINNRGVRRSNRANLELVKQLAHGQSPEGKRVIKAQNALLANNGDGVVNLSTHETVSYSPPSASYAIGNKIFKATTLAGYAQKGMTDIPDFPDDAINVKPVFKILPAGSQKTKTKFAIATWHGSISTLDSFPQKDWKTCVYVDITNKSKGDGSQLPFVYDSKTSVATAPPATPGATYNLDDFIHFTMNDEDAYYFNKEFSENASNPLKAEKGDIAILVAMHVTTKENKRWTWQSFWWAPDPVNPPSPSSKAIAAQRPAQLTGAPAHYAMTVAYYMVNPKEPYASTTPVTGNPNIGFNPYLEASFGPDATGKFSVFGPDIARSFVQTPAGKTIPTYVGVRTNCMSCHISASVAPSVSAGPNASNTQYFGDTYIGFNDKMFNGQLRVDFAWSIVANIDTTGWAAFVKNNPPK
jgi:hypothetical protein